MTTSSLNDRRTPIEKSRTPQEEINLAIHLLKKNSYFMGIQLKQLLKDFLHEEIL